MKQIIQNLKTGETILEEVPSPMVRKGHILIRTHKSLVSLGTEKMLVEFSKSSLISKARQQPDKVKQVLDKIKSDGLFPTLEAIFNKLDEPLPLGYCNAGEVIGVGEGVKDFKIGDRVISNGGHAEFVCIPQNLCASIPDNVSYEEATFTVIGSIGLQGIRLANPSFGERVVVVGLGLIGLITAELLKANGCKVIGYDFDERKVQLAREKGILAFNASNGLDPVKTTLENTGNIGADAVIITASTKSNDVISQAANMSRKRGRIILVGVIGLDINRAEFYKKELTFQVSCSYGPGRYDDAYELNGMDYPLAFVRWTEKRNFEAILESISNGSLDVKRLITDQTDLKDYMNIYGQMGAGSIASIINYPVDENQYSNKIQINPNVKDAGKGVIGLIGAGNFTKMTLLPALKNTGAYFKYIASAGGLSAKMLASKYQFEASTTDYKTILEDKQVDLVFITTRHNNHAQLVCETITNGKHVFVEKPLAINEEQLNKVITTWKEFPNQTISVGFNRRFSPFIQKAKHLIGNNQSPINMIATMNAGYIPEEVWVHDMQVGGGRIIGEACHFIDLMIYLNGSLVTQINMTALGQNPMENTDNAIITLKFANGSQGVINYFANGSKKYSKERVEIYSQGRTLIMDNFRKLEGYGFNGFSSMKGRQDKGHKKQFELLIDMIKKGGKSLIPAEEIINSAEASIAAIQSLKENKPISIQ